MKINPPTHCPVCESTLQLVGDQLFCRNKACPAQLNKKLENFCKVLKIKGMGPKTVDKLGLSDLSEIFYLDLDTVSEALGEKTAVKLLDEIEKAKSADLATVLASFSVPLIGETASTKVASVVTHISEINPETCKQAGLGEKATNNLCTWLSEELEDIMEFMPFDFKSATKKVSSNATGETVCISGKLVSCKTKAEATNLLEAAGYTVVDSVTKTLNYLLDEADKGSSKRQKAEEYGISIINNINILLDKKHD